LKINTYNLFNRPEKNYKPIDGIRAIAVLWVIIFHAWLFQYNSFPVESDFIINNSIFTWISKGDLGVDLFFVISGFLIGTILFKEFNKSKTINFKRFYVRRFLRLMPVYIFSMIIGVYFLQDSPAGNWEKAWANLLYVNNYVRESYMGWTWSLAIEEQFYIVIPFLIAFIIPKFRNKFFIFFFLAIVPVCLSYYYLFILLDYSVPFNNQFTSEGWADWFWEYYMLTHLRYGGLLSGVIAAYLNVNFSRKISQFFEKNIIVSNFLILLSFFFFISISTITLGQWTEVENSIFYSLNPEIGRYYEIVHREVFCYSVAFIILSCIYSKSLIIKPVNNFLSLKFFYPIAQVSYSAYLFHEMFMLWFFPIFTENFQEILSPEIIIFTNSIISLFAIILFATLMYLFIEQPFQKIKDNSTISRLAIPSS